MPWFPQAGWASSVRIRTKLYAATAKVKIQSTLAPPGAAACAAADRLHPAEDLLHPFAFLLTDRVAGCRVVRVNRTAAPLRGFCATCGVTCISRRSATKLPCRSSCRRPAYARRGSPVEHQINAASRSAVPSAACVTIVRPEPVAVLHQHVPQVASLACCPALLIQPRVRIGGGLMRVVLPPLRHENSRRIRPSRPAAAPPRPSAENSSGWPRPPAASHPP